MKTVQISLNSIDKVKSFVNGIVYDVFPEGIKPRYRINKGECQGFLTKEEFLTQVFTKKCHVFVK